MSAVNNHLFEVYASDATKNEDETQIAECKKNFKSTSTHMRANVFRSDENIFMETEEKEKTTAEISKNETLDEECKRARNNNKGKNVKMLKFNTTIFGNEKMKKANICAYICN